MLQEILPASVIAVETREDAMDVELFPVEQATLGKAVEKRRREFTTARACARAALAQLGLPPTAIETGERGEPRWPSGIVGSITHCDGYRACVVARASDILTVGIDAEPNAALPDGVLSQIARVEELGWLAELQREEPQIHWDRLLFSAKESVYKAWFPVARRWLGFEDAILTVDRLQRTFAARLLTIGSLPAEQPLARMSGRWLVHEGLVVTAIALAIDHR